MAKGLNDFLLFLLIGFTTVAAVQQKQNVDIISFTQPLYHGTVQEKAVSSVVASDVMMGMWLTAVTQNVRFDVVENDRGFTASKRISGNFIFLELRTSSVSRTQDIRIRALAPDFNQETFCTVRVKTIDVNDFQPLFPPDPYSVSVDEDTKVGTVITYVKATDSDRDPENTRFYYSLPDLTSDYFAVHPTTGAVMLTAPLNAQSQASHSVKIQATDRKAALAGTAQPKTTTLTVLVKVVNAHPPMITVREPMSFDSTVPDGSRRHWQVYSIIQVRDPDLGVHGQTLFPVITHCDVPRLFAVERRQAHNEYQLVFTRKPPPINGVINVTLQVSDRGVPPLTSSTVIPVKLFNRRLLVPVFTKLSFLTVLSEISPPFTQVGFVDAKLPNSDQADAIRYSIIHGNEDKIFDINSMTSLVTTVKNLNRRATDKFNLTVAAVNSAAVDFVAENTTMLTVLVQDANDHDPIFDKHYYATSLAENAPIGSVLTQVQAHDEDHGLNRTLTYSLVAAAGLPFSIDPFNGTIYTTGLLDSDILSRTTYKLRVRATDNGVPFNRKSECFVFVEIINTNDNPPVFSEIDCVVTIPAGTTKGSKVLQIEPIDIDRNSVTCTLLDGGDGWFEVKAKTCELRLIEDLTNTENGRRFTLRVSAFDGKHTSDEMIVNVTISTAENSIVKSCQDTGEIGRFEEAMNSLHLGTSHFGDKNTGLNRTSQLPNKHKPKLVSRSSFRISEDTKVGIVVMRVLAKDKDTGYNGKLWYTITSGNLDSCFIIDSQSGLIRLARPLDRELRSSYNLTLKICDLGAPSKCIVARIKVIVTDVNDNSPQFSQSIYTFEIPENVSIGYRILSSIQASDKDEGKNAMIRYSFLSDMSEYNPFKIDPFSGYVNVTRELDRETIPQFNLTALASDSAPAGPRTSRVKVRIKILDVNDNPPQFYKSLYRIQVSEDLPKHAVVFRLQAHDADFGENSVVRYTLTDGVTNRNDAKTRFQVDDRTGAIRLSAKLDARVQNRYNITARARDSKKLFSTCYIEVEVLPVNRNLYAPYFKYRDIRMEVEENAYIGTTVGAVSAVDEDTTSPERDISYFIVDGTGLGIFAIDQNTGTITTLKSLDRETQQYYWITVLAQDLAAVPLTGHVFVLVEIADVNDNSPYSIEPMYFASIPESSQLGSAVIQINALDSDSEFGSNLTYSMLTNKYFAIDRNTGIITTAVSKKLLDRESLDTSQLSFDVTISDSGTPPLSSLVRVVVNITDVNDNHPVFLPFVKKKISLPARNRTRTATDITRVVAHDQDFGRNSIIDYVLERSKKFMINSKTGVISTSKAFTEKQKSVLKVEAYDLGSKQRRSKYRLEIEWTAPPKRSRIPPVFDKDDDVLLEGSYFEHVDIGYVTDESFVGRRIRLFRATDYDSNRLWFRIIAGNEDNMFAVDSERALYVAGEPDAEVKDFYNLTIEVTDGYNSASKQVTVSIGDINDHRPAFSEKIYNATIDENSPSNTRVIQLAVSDLDRTFTNRNFIFKIRGSVDPASATKFRIAADGTIYSTIRLDREAQRKHVLFVEVDDQGVPGALQAYCQVVITVTDQNEHPPRFTSSSYQGKFFSTSVDSQTGVDDTREKVVVTVRATDKDFGENARIFYSIDSGDADTLWNINPSTGEITARQNFVLSKGNNVKQYSFLVKATDGGRPPLSSTTSVTIDVVTPSSAKPQFESDNIEIEIPENTNLGSFVTMVSASASSGVTYGFQSGNEDGRFYINPHSGVVSLSGSLDRETRDSHVLVVSCVTTEGLQATSQLTVRVLDVNDNRPRFLSSSYTGFVSESSVSVASSSVIDEKNNPVVVAAFDPDLGNNAKVNYVISEANAEIKRRFFIDANTGALLAKAGNGLFDHETVKKYQFKVQCYDLGSPLLHSEQQTLVTVHVTDANDTVPAFTQSQYNFQVLLPTAAGVLISTDVKAEPSRSIQERNSFLSYSISNGNENGAFKIDSQSGALSVEDPTLLNSNDVYNLRVRVTDGKRSSTSEATIAVSSLTTDDDFLFTQAVYEGSVQENSTETRALVATSIAGIKLHDNVGFRILNLDPWFQIGSTSGVISTSGVPIDRERSSVYDLLVEAIDYNKVKFGSVRRLARCNVQIHVVDVNDNAPRFLKSLYYATVQVEARPSTVVKQVRAFDADFGTNSVISYNLEGDHADLFDIDARDGLITLRRTPDVNEDGGNVKFNVTVIARDMGSPSLFGRAVVIVSIVNRATPVFTQPFYGVVSVLEDAQPHTVVTDVVKASSPDGSIIYYTIEQGDPLQQFDIDFTTGTITTRGVLDHELKARYRLRIRARNALSPVFADTELELEIDDVNDHRPVFAKSVYAASLSETAAVGTTVTQVKATDCDSGRNGQILYKIVDYVQFDGGYFHIDQDTGVIWTARELDREEKSILNFVVRASDLGAPIRHTDVMVTLHVDDVNDNVPSFVKETYEYVISVRSKVGDFVGGVAAVDLDASDRLTYSMNQNGDNQLQIDSSTGLVTLAQSVSLPVQTNVSVTDGVYTSSVAFTVLLSSEDTDPTAVVFEKTLYSFKVFENEPIGTRVGKVVASGLGSLVYRIENDGMFSEMFSIESSTGKIRTVQIIDREFVAHRLQKEKGTVTVVELQVTSIDSKGNVARCKVRVRILDENDNAPLFTQRNYGAVLLQASTIKDSVINLTATDADLGENGRILYAWYEASALVKQNFALNMNTGEISLRDIALPFGHKDVLQFFVEASDRLHTSVVAVTLYLATDAHSVPRFSQKNVATTVAENVPVGSEIATVQASTDNSLRVIYALAEDYVGRDTKDTEEESDRTASSLFNIEPSTGLVTLNSPLDRETKASHVITVLAFVETTPELVASTQVFVTVTDVNDNAPTFTTSEYYASVVENTPAQNSVIQVQAVDLDAGKFGLVTYSLLSPEDNSEVPFTINSKTGIISTTAALDRELVSRYDLVVQAVDGDKANRQLSTTHVLVQVVDVNDNPPVFSQDSYVTTISESALIGQPFSNLIKVTDPDVTSNSSIRCYIVEGDPRKYFDLVWDQSSAKENSMFVGVKVVKNLNRETTPSYTLAVLATDGLHSSTTTLHVRIGDVNDNAPFCQQLFYDLSVSENLPVRSFVGRVRAVDKDGDQFGKIVYRLSGEGSESFSIDAVNGEICTAEVLDREAIAEYHLTVTAGDSEGLHCESQTRFRVTSTSGTFLSQALQSAKGNFLEVSFSKAFVTINDVNDHPPHLDTSSLRAAAKEDTPVNSSIHRVVAQDTDLGSNGSFVFTLMDSVDEQFYIEPHTGVLVLLKPLDRETVALYELKVKVQDRGNKKRLSSTGILQLHVLDINDNPPVFDQDQFDFQVPENATLHQLIARVSASSLDTGANAQLHYEITRGNQHGKFQIDSDSGEVRLVSHLDFETDQSYVLTVMASDSSDNPLTSECTLRVNVTDVNDNPPQFTSTYKVSVLEDVAIGHVILTVSAVDWDSGEAGNVSFHLLPGNENNTLFRIDPGSGKLSVMAPGLDYEQSRYHRVVVVASDAGLPSLKTKTTVEVLVVDVNDNRPVFAVSAPLGSDNNDPVCASRGSNCTVYAHESSSEPVNRGIAFINATDADGKGNQGPFRFMIKEGNSKDLFYLDHHNILKARRPLTLESAGLPSKKVQSLVYRLMIGAEDSGSPLPLRSEPDLTVNVVVLKENQHAPEMVPHHVQIATSGNEFLGDLITRKLHATDRDAFDQDRLRFSLAFAEDFERFVINPLSGAITTLWPLTIGTHQITVRVSDGSRYSFSNVTVTVNHVGKKALGSSVAVTFSGINGVDEYLALYYPIFVNNLESIMPLGFKADRDLLVMSLQKHQDNIQLLFAIRKPQLANINPGFYSSKSLRGFLEKSRELLTAERLSVQVKWIEGTACSADNCPHGSCLQLPFLEPFSKSNDQLLVTTNFATLVTPSFGRTQTCQCPIGTAGASCESICSAKFNPCSKLQACVVDELEPEGYRCDQQEPVNAVLAFSGQAYATYSLETPAGSAPFHLTTRLRTYQSNATVFYASGSRHFARLETAGGLLRFTFDCGSGPQTMMQDQRSVSDGRWYQVSIESRADEESCAFKLTIDGKYVASAKAPDGEAQIDLSAITFGGKPFTSRKRRSAETEKRDASRRKLIGHGYRGCLKELNINGNDLSRPERSGVQLETKKNVLNKCRNSEINMGACEKSPCLNGGRCMPLSDGSHECECPDTFNGVSCEIPDPCGSIPCRNKGYCYSDGQNIQCRCSSEFTGARCEVSVQCTGVDFCSKNGQCATDGNGRQSCFCQPGWTGSKCEMDVNECESDQDAIKRCGGKKNCFNFAGKYACNCTGTANRDSACDNVELFPRTGSLPWYIWVIMAAVAFAVVSLIVVVCVCRCRRRTKERDDLDDSEFRPRYHPVNRSVAPPRVPQRPVDYQRSSRDSHLMESRRIEDQEQRNPLIGYVQPQLPVTSSMSGASDSDSIKKPSPSWQEYDQNKFNGSVPSSVHHSPTPRKTSSPSIPEQQSWDWDVSDWKPEGSGVVPSSVANVSCSRGGRSRAREVPGSPVSHHSVNSMSTCRSCRSNRTDALSGHYKHGKAKRDQQLMQLIKYIKNAPEAESIELQRALSSLGNRGDSRNSSFRSASSRHPPLGFHPLAQVASLPSSSLPSCSVESRSLNVSDDEYEDNREEGVFDRISRRKRLNLNLSPIAPADLPPPPSDYELQALKADNKEDKLLDSSQFPAASSNKSYSSLLNTPFNLEIPTPAIARSLPFHPDQHLLNHHCNISDLSLASDSLSEGFKPSCSGLPCDGNFVDRGDEVGPYTTPPPPQRHDSARLAMSSLSEEEEETVFMDTTGVVRKRQVNGRPPVYPKHKKRRAKAKQPAKEKRNNGLSNYERSFSRPSHASSTCPIFLDTPGTTEV